MLSLKVTFKTSLRTTFLCRFHRRRMWSSQYGSPHIFYSMAEPPVKIVIKSSVICHLHEQAFSSWCKYLKKNRKDSQELQTWVQTLFELQRHIDDIPPRVFTSFSEPILGASIFNLQCIAWWKVSLFQRIDHIQSVGSTYQTRLFKLPYRQI